MLHKTHGIVLRYYKYGETSIIVKIFTEKFGLQSYIVNGVRSKSGKNKISLFQPMTQLELVAYHKQSSGLQRLSEQKCSKIYSSIPYDQKKISILLFINEIVQTVIIEEHPDPELFELIIHTLDYLDKVDTNFDLLHLYFLVQLATHMGFMTDSAEQFTNEFKYKLSEEELFYFDKIRTTLPTSGLTIPGKIRSRLLDVFLLIFTRHYEAFHQLNSIAVFRSLNE